MNRLEAFIKAALHEDLQKLGDVSSNASIDPGTVGRAKLLLKEPGILAGVELAEKVFHLVDSNLKLNLLMKDGQEIEPGTTAFTVEGNVHSILKVERLVLNCMQRMSGIATLTNQFVQKTQGTPTKILDTRKTTPNLRFIEKWAVRLGGGYNHRFGLFDMVMLKDNHIDFCGGITKAVKKVKKYLTQHQLNLPIEVETRTLADVEEVLKTGAVNRVMFDNFSTENVRKAVILVNKEIETEVSGNINLNTIRSYAECHPDFISVGAITHSAVSLDLSLKAVDTRQKEKV